MGSARLLISDLLLGEYLTVDEALGISKRLNNKVFRKSDTPLSYRQVNTLDRDKLLGSERRREGGWHTFSFYELVYILIVKELKEYGFTHDRLRELWESFFKEPVFKSGKGRKIAEAAIGCTLGQVEILITVDSKGNVTFYDPPHFAFLGGDSRSYVLIKLNDIVNQLWTITGSKPFPIKGSLRQMYGKANSHNITIKEQKLLKIIRNRDYSVIRVKKKDGKLATVYAEKIGMVSDNIDTSTVLKILKERDFQDIRILKRDGNMVNLKIEDVFKL